MVGRLPKDQLTPNEFLDHETALGNLELKQLVLKTILVLYALGYGCVLVIIMCYSFKLIQINESFVHWLGGGFIAQIVSSAGMLVRHFFGKNSN